MIHRDLGSIEKIIVQYPEIASHTDKLGRNLLHLFPWDDITSENTMDFLQKTEKRERIKNLILRKAGRDLMGQVDQLFLLTPPEYFLYNMQNQKVKNKSTNTQTSTLSKTDFLIKIHGIIHDPPRVSDDCIVADGVKKVFTGLFQTALSIRDLRVPETAQRRIVNLMNQNTNEAYNLNHRKFWTNLLEKKNMTYLLERDIETALRLADQVAPVDADFEQVLLDFEMWDRALAEFLEGNSYGHLFSMVETGVTTIKDIINTLSGNPPIVDPFLEPPLD